MIKKFIRAAIAAVTLCLAVSVPLYASAATPEEAAEIARQYGYSEDMIQQAWNEYNANPELYTPDVIDNYIEQLKESGQKIVTEVPYDPQATIPAAATSTVSAASTAKGSATAATASSSANNSTTTTADDGTITLTMPDGDSFTRISKEAFIALSYEDKQAYLKTFTAEQQKVFIENLSPEEYKSLMKQLPADKKVEVIDELTKITDDLGFTLTVDEISDENVKVSMKNQDGELVAVGQAKEVVENTGYDRRGILFFSAGMIAAGIVAMIAVAKKCFGRDSSEV